MLCTIALRSAPDVIAARVAAAASTSATTDLFMRLAKRDVDERTGDDLALASARPAPLAHVGARGVDGSALNGAGRAAQTRGDGVGICDHRRIAYPRWLRPMPAAREEEQSSLRPPAAGGNSALVRARSPGTGGAMLARPFRRLLLLREDRRPLPGARASR